MVVAFSAQTRLAREEHAASKRHPGLNSSAAGSSISAIFGEKKTSDLANVDESVEKMQNQAILIRMKEDRLYK
jgi:hypothetical protein